MKKIPTMFERDWEGDKSRVLDKPTPGCEWVFAGEGVATRKYDGVACMFDGERWFKRREIRMDDIARKGMPDGFVEADRDPTMAKITGWVPIGEGPEDKYLRSAIVNTPGASPGTYEFLGPKSQGGIERDYDGHFMLKHSNAEHYKDCPRTFDGIRDFMAERDIEGIVFHNIDGRMAKIKKRDFGMKRTAAQVI